MTDPYDVVIVGGGAAGIFAAIRAKELTPSLRLIVLEGSPRLLRKVEISGGGRCNVTHDCDDLDLLLDSYPRGGFRLEPILSRFMPLDTVEWFQRRGVPLKTEQDGRIFPVSNSSQTIIECLLGEAKRLGVELKTRSKVKGIEIDDDGGFLLIGTPYKARRLLLATGGGSQATSWLSQFGHQLVSDVPSLFTFCCQHRALEGLQGLSVASTALTLRTSPVYRAEGPLLITHWGLSGPAVLRLSAFAARTLADLKYRADLVCDLLCAYNDEEVRSRLDRSDHAQLGTASPFPELPKRFWRRLVEQAGLATTQPWNSLNDKQRDQIKDTLKGFEVAINGKGVFKEEFVTAGGLVLHEIDVYTMESRLVPGLHIAGELLDVDGITGGFNFQNAWASGYIAGEALSGS